ncbi:MAG: hypothetical protein ACYDES_07010 [Acidimicrobiales bacterium]
MTTDPISRDPGSAPAVNASALARAAVVLAVASGVWAPAAIGALHGAGGGAPWFAGAVLLGVLCVPAARLARRSGHLAGIGPIWRPGQRRRFALIVAGEVIVMIAAVAVASASGHGLIAAPLVTLVVGMHFFPLARLFAQRLYVLTGAALCLLAAASLAVVPRWFHDASAHGGRIFLTGIVNDGGTSLILWVTAASIIISLARRAGWLDRESTRRQTLPQQPA